MSELVLENEKELPKGWTRTKLDEISLDVIGGGTPSRNNTEYFNGNIIWLTPTEIPKDRISRIFDSQEKITELGLKKSSAKIIPKNSVLLTSRASIGYVAIAGTDVTTNQGFASFICSRAVFNYFLAYWLMANKRMLEANAKGTTFKEISKSRLREIEIPIPPLNEQKRIVTKIEELFSKIDAIETYLQKIKIQLRIQKESLLNSEFQVWFDKGPFEKLDNLMASRKIGLDRSRNRQFKEGVSYLKMNNITIDGKLDLRSIVCVKEEEELSNYLLQPGDILFNTRNSYELVGKTAFWNGEISPCVYNNNIMRIRVEDLIEPKYLTYFMNTGKFRRTLLSIKRATTNICAIYDKDLKTQNIPIPPIDEQRRIVSRIELGLSIIDNIQNNYKLLYRKMKTIRASILALAFKGKLVPQDPNDEPAEILLEKIKQESQKIFKAKSVPKRRKSSQ